MTAQGAARSGGFGGGSPNASLAKGILLPELPKGAVVILDNARFHKSKKLRKIAKAEGFTLLFLPPYSPQYNLIEHEWFPVKNAARKILQTFHDLPAAVETAILSHD
jgi:transposase